MKVLLYSILITMFCAECHTPKPKEHNLKGKLLPNYSVLLPDSTTFLNTANIKKGMPFAIVYFSPDCPYSKAQIEDMLKNLSKFKATQLYLITSGRFEEMRNFYINYKLQTYKNIFVALDSADFFGNYFNVVGMPFTAVYGRDKKLELTYTGLTKSRVLIKKINELYHEKS